MGIAGNLNPTQLELFNSEGYLVLESFASPDEVRSLRSRMEQLLDEFDFSSKASIFSTTNQVNIQSCSSPNNRFFVFQLTLLVSHFVSFSGCSKKLLMITSSKVLRRFPFSLKVCYSLVEEFPHRIDFDACQFVCISRFLFDFSHPYLSL